MILTVNAGSSSLRCELFGLKNETIQKKHLQGKFTAQDKNLALELFKDLPEQIPYIAHRVVHGGEKFKSTSEIKGKVLQELEKIAHLAPLHNPINIALIKAAQKLWPKARHFAVFDTAFHSEIPEKAFLYGLPYELYKKKCLRRFGFHGSNHSHVAKEAMKILKTKKANLITCHMGNGISLSAIKNGKSIDTSMGFTPLEGPPMGTRSGSLDPGIVLKLVKDLGLEKTEELLQKKSGILGVSGISHDVRKLYALKDTPETKRTFAVLSYQIAKLISSYFASLEGLPNAIVFTGGIGENAFYLREEICAYFKNFGMKLNAAANKKNALEISATNSKIRVFVIPSGEEIQMALEVKVQLVN